MDWRVPFKKKELSAEERSFKKKELSAQERSYFYDAGFNVQGNIRL